MTDIDLAVVGGGPAGLGAALTAARDGWTVSVFDAEGGGGRLYKLDVIHDYPGAVSTVAGPELAGGLVESVLDAGVEIVFERVETLSRGDGWQVRAGGSTVAARAVVFATGQADAVLDLDGESQLRGHGLSYCASCDGPLFVGKRVAVLGVGDWSADEAVLLARHAAQTTLVCPADRLHVARWRREQLREAGVRIIEAATPTHLDARDGVLVGVDVATGGGSERLDIEGFFPLVGLRPAVDAAPPETLTDANTIAIGPGGATSLPGLFAAGDVTHTGDGLVSAAMAGGVRAGNSAGLYLQGIV